MNTTTAEAIETRAWLHPRTGERRHYAADVADAMGVEVERYKTGRISSASHNGIGLSNTRAREVLSCRIWWEDDGTLHAPEVIHDIPVSEWVAEQVAARGLDFLANRAQGE